MSYPGLEPLRVPDTFYDRDDVTDALRRHDFADLFHLLQQQLGASQTKIGAAISMGQGHVHAILKRKRQVIIHDVIQRIASGLQMPDHARILLGLHPLAHQHPTSQAAEAPAAAVMGAAHAPLPSVGRIPSRDTGCSDDRDPYRGTGSYVVTVRESTSDQLAEGFGTAVARARAERHLSLRQLARLAHTDAGHLSKIENGHRPPPTPEVVKAIDDALCAGGALIRIANTEREQRAPAGQRRTVEIDTCPTRRPIRNDDDAFDPEEEAVRRRRLLEDFAALGLAGPFVGMETLRHSLHGALADEPHELAEWEAIAWDYACTYATTPPQALMRDLTTDLLVADAQLRRLDRDSVAWKDMCRVLASLAVVAAHTFANLASFRASRRWWRTARTYSDRSTDNQLRTWVYGREVIGALYEQRPLDGVLALADTAAAIPHTPGIGTGTILIGRAQVLASLGRTREARQAMKLVYAAANRLPTQVTADSESLYGWSEHRLRHGESFVYANIGAIKDAAVAQDRALTLYPHHMVRERAQIQLHQAIRLVHEGDPGAAARHAVDVLTGLHAAQRTEVVIEVARSVVRAMPPSEHQRPEIAALRECITLPPAPGTSLEAP